ncbi:MAG: GspH/FimT family pseudopilin, partial [Woeseiaceae bacterium]
MQTLDRLSAHPRRSSENQGRTGAAAYIPRMNIKRQHGFTLYELLVTLLVIGVVLTVGIPNLSDFSRSSRITGIANDLHSSFMVARSEAARAKANITICASTDPSGAAACDGASFDDGWIIFLDLNDNVARDSVEEHVLRSHAAIDDTIDIITNPA